LARFSRSDGVALLQLVLDIDLQQTAAGRADGAIAEATAANVFIIHNGTLLTPPEGPKILSGITRGKILEAARAAGIAAAERRVTKVELLGADEAFLSSTTAEVVPILAVDGHKIGAGPLAPRIYDQFIKMFAS